MRNKIILDTLSDAIAIASIASNIDGTVTITDNKNLRVNAKSVMGAIYALEFNELWIESDMDIYDQIKQFVSNQ